MNRYELRKIREEKIKITLSKMANRIGISTGHLSKIENGSWPARMEDVLKIAKAYQLDSAAVLRDFLRQSEPSEVLDVLSILLSSTRTTDFSQTDLKLLSGIHALKKNKHLEKALRGILKELIDISIKMLSPPASGAFQIVKDCSDKNSYQSMMPGSAIQHRCLYGSKSAGCPFVIELLRIPPKYGGYHRAQKIGESNPLEFWCIISGRGIIAVRDEPSGYIVEQVGLGSCGYYKGIQDHIWQNISEKDDLLVFFVLYPYLGAASGENSVWSIEGVYTVPGSAEEFLLGKETSRVPKDLYEKLIDAISNLQNKEAISS
jgi:transcriptional regulator with XRE-family HTH domain